MASVKYIINNRTRQFTQGDTDWFAICEAHGGLIGTSTKLEAKQARPNEFCFGCQRAL